MSGEDDELEQNLLKSLKVLEDKKSRGGPKYDSTGRRISRALSEYSQYTDPDEAMEYVSLNDSSFLSCYINLLNTIIGSGVLSLPYAVGYCGAVLGVILIIFFAAVNTISCHLLTLCARRVDPPASFYTVTATSVPQMTFLIDFAVALQSFGVCASYFIVIGGLMPDVMENFGGSGFWVAREPWIFMGFAVVGPLSCFKRVDALKYTSGLSVMFVMFLAVLVFLYAIPSGMDPCAYDDDEEHEDGTCVGNKVMAVVNVNTFRVLSIFVFGFAIQPNIFQVVNELRNPVQSRVDTVTVASLATALCVYILVAVAGFTTYGDNVESNILISYPKTAVTSIARLFVSLLVAFSYPLVVHPGRNSMLGLWRGFDTDEDMWLRHNKFRYIVTTCFLLGASLGTSLLVTDLGVVFSFLGATSSSMMSLIIPGAAYYRMHQEDKVKTWELYGAAFLFVLGMVLTPVCLVCLFL